MFVMMGISFTQVKKNETGKIKSCLVFIYLTVKVTKYY